MKYNAEIVHGTFSIFTILFEAERDKSAHGVTINFFHSLRAHFYMHNLHRNDILLNFQNLIKFIVCKFFQVIYYVIFRRASCHAYFRRDEVIEWAG